jgi:hypothetical protein
MTTSASMRFSTARVFAGVGTAFARRWRAILALTLLFDFAPSLILGLALRSQSAVSIRIDIPPAAGAAHHALAPPSISAPADFLAHNVGLVLAAFGLLLVAGRALAAMLNALTVAALVDDPRSPASILLGCGRAAGPLALATLLYLAALTAGAIFIVPALIIWAAWSLVYPVLLSEKTSVLGAFRRSAELSRGHRWLILALRGMIIAAWIFLRTVMAILVVSVMATGRWMDAVEVVTLVAAPVISSLAALFYELLVGALYVELRRTKEGLAPGMADQVFG